jgi:hypothetical protein
MDDTAAQEILAYITAVSKDIVTPMGIPIDTMNRTNFDQLSTPE